MNSSRIQEYNLNKLWTGRRRSLYSSARCYNYHRWMSQYSLLDHSSKIPAIYFRILAMYGTHCLRPDPGNVYGTHYLRQDPGNVYGTHYLRPNLGYVYGTNCLRPNPGYVWYTLFMTWIRTMYGTHCLWPESGLCMVHMHCLRTESGNVWYTLAVYGPNPGYAWYTLFTAGIRVMYGTHCLWQKWWLCMVHIRAMVVRNPAMVHTV